MIVTQNSQHQYASEFERQFDKPSQYLSFKIADETYAVGILQVKEILRYEELTKVPYTPKSICGVMNLRGTVVPVVDLAVKFGLPASEITKWTCTVIVETVIDGEHTVMGIIADSVNEVLDLKNSDIEPPPPFGTKVHVDYLMGMGKAERRFILILNIDKVLSADEMAIVAKNLDVKSKDIESSSDGKNETAANSNAASVSAGTATKDRDDLQKIKANKKDDNGKSSTTSKEAVTKSSSDISSALDESKATVQSKNKDALKITKNTQKKEASKPIEPSAVGQGEADKEADKNGISEEQKSDALKGSINAEVQAKKQQQVSALGKDKESAKKVTQSKGKQSDHKGGKNQEG